MDFLTWPPAGITNVVQFMVFGTCAMLLIGVARAGFGGSIGLLAVPLMVCATGNDPALATGLMLPLLIACDYAAMCYYWRRWNLRAVAMLLPGTALGIVAGVAALWFVRRAGAESQKQLADAALMLAIGVISLGFVAIRVFGSLRTRPLAFRPAPW